ATHRVPHHPGSQAAPRQIELLSDDIAGVVVVAVPWIGFDTFSISNLVHHRNNTAGPSPNNSHVLEFKLSLGSVKAMEYNDPGRLAVHLHGKIEISGHPEARLALIDDVISLISVTPKLRNDPCLQRRPRREDSQGEFESLQPDVAKPLPVGNRIHLIPFALL